MGKMVKSRGGGKIRLGTGDEFGTCVYTEHRGWGTDCEKIVLKKDGYYHCNDCGLVFRSLNLTDKIDVGRVKCKCSKLANFVEWVYESFYGYDLPHSYYRCIKCGRVYESPDHEHLAPLDVQESEAARAYAIMAGKYIKKRLNERLNKAGEAVQTLRSILNGLSDTDKQSLKDKISTLLSQ